MSDQVHCKHGNHAPIDKVTSEYYGGDLFVDQSEPSRHGCPICAYTRGWEDAVAAITKKLTTGLR